MGEVVPGRVLPVPEEFGVLVKGPGEPLLLDESFVVVEGDAAVHGVAGHKHHLAGVQQVGREHAQRQVGLDHPGKGKKPNIKCRPPLSDKFFFVCILPR